MSNTADITIFGKEKTSGEPVINYGTDAINEALTLFFTSKKGETLYQPEDGGLLEQFLFKNLSSSNLDVLGFQIRTALDTNFVPSIRVKQLELTPDLTNRLLSVKIAYEISATQETAITEIFVNTTVSANPSLTYTDIPDTGDNLYTFIQINLDKVPTGTLLEFNYNEDSWVWYRFKFTEFNFATDSRASDILILANG